MKKLLLLLIACGLVRFSGLAQQPSATELAAKVDRHYNSLHSLEVHFTQQYEGMGMNRREEGVLLLKKPGRMRWTYTKPEGKLFLVDGKYGYFYSPGDTEVQQVPVKKLDDMRSPLSLLLGHTQLSKELTGLTIAPAAGGAFALSGIPKGMEKRVASFEVTATADGTIRSMRVEETDGIVNTFSFSGEAVNPPAKDSDFVFQLPAGAHFVEGLPPV